MKFLELRDGRQISYREQGVPKHKARRSLLVLHGLGSSRLASMPGTESPKDTPGIQYCILVLRFSKIIRQGQ